MINRHLHIATSHWQTGYVSNCWTSMGEGALTVELARMTNTWRLITSMDEIGKYAT